MQANALVHQAGYQAQDILTPKTFAGVSVPLLYYALHRDSLCRNAHPCSTRRKEDFLACWTGKFLYNRTSFAETDLTDLITELATNYVGNVSISGNTDVRLSRNTEKTLCISRLILKEIKCCEVKKITKKINILVNEILFIILKKWLK